MTDPICPAYRLRLFLSVDLVGSTAFKAGAGSEIQGNETSPRWVYQLRGFYREFPKLLSERFEKILDGETSIDGSSYPNPRVWKTVGDEILFCNKIFDLEHLGYCVKSFMQALEHYGLQVNTPSSNLDVKGSAWTAAFPSPNVTVGVVDKDETHLDGIWDESFESNADASPNSYDFLGKEMDSGFRIAKNASSDKLALSATLAYLLSQAVCDGLFSARFNYHGREILKGVINERPYPVVTIDMERNSRRRELLAYERAVTRAGDIEAYHLRNFLKLLLIDENLEFPFLFCKKVNDHSIKKESLTSYLKFQSNWEATMEEERNRSSSEERDVDGLQAGGGEIPSEANNLLDDTISSIATEQGCQEE